MNKREYLESTGYKYYSESKIFKKVFAYENGDYLVIAHIDLNYDYYFLEPDAVCKQKDIDNLQIAFNDLKRDFEEMKKYED